MIGSGEVGERTVLAYLLYQQHLARANAMDFDDLLLQTLVLLRGHEDVRSRWQGRFGHILVDEYQDTSPAQHHIVVMLARRHRQVTVVGDPDQAIYAFRGASPAIIEGFGRDLSGTATVTLDRNYRNTRNILDAAAAVRLMTVHAAKGLEFRDVYIIGMEEGALPHSRSRESPGGIGEEMRIAYVAMTRAKQTLTLTCACARTLQIGDPRPIYPSRFIRAIPLRVRQDSGTAQRRAQGRPRNRRPHR